MGFAEDIAEGTKIAICGWLANGGNAAAAYWIARGSRTPWTAVAGGAAALGLLALNYGCNYNPDADPEVDFDGCRRADPGGAVQMFWFLNGTKIGQLAPPAEEIVSFRWEPFGNGGFRWWLTQRELDGVTRDYTFEQGNDQGGTPSFASELVSGTCAEQSPGGPLPPPDITYTSPTTNCVYVISHQAYVLDETGTVTPVLKISQGISSRTTGGIIGGCNFDPVLVFPAGGDSGGGGGGCCGDRVYPWKDDPDGPDGLPWWWSIAQVALGNMLASLINDLLTDFEGATARRVAALLTGSETGLLPAVKYDLYEPCTPDGEDQRFHELDIPMAPALTAVAARCDALEIFQQYQKDYRQPICSRSKPVGNWVSVSFVSDEISPNGERPLRKYLRYLDQANRPLEDHGAHWENFVWTAGPVIVGHKGSTWGVPQVWAASAAEGQRVLRHAAAIAGVDPDSQGEWYFTASSDARYGQPGTMRVERRADRITGQQFLRVSKRDSPNGLPLLPAS